MKAFLFLILVGTSAFGKDAYLSAGDKIEKEYLQYNKLLESHYLNLKKLLKEKSPKLLEKLSPVPPAPLTAGYQLLPKFIEDQVREKDAPNESEIVYSWPRTQEFLESQMRDLSKQVKAIKTIKNLNYENLIENYRALDDNQQTIGSHIEYNRLWQSQIAAYRLKYEENNELYKKLKSGTQNRDTVVIEILKKLMSEPHKAVVLKKNSEKQKIIQVSMLTDIEDKDFVETFRRTIEEYWHLKEGGVEYQVELKIRFIKPLDLYLPDKPPAKGEEVDIAKHAEHFPNTEIALTTGTGTTYYSTSKTPFITIGISPIEKRVLAHEFGHALTLNDAYFRAYQNKDKQGFEIIEVIPDYTDIMAAPAFGSVKKHHFDLAISALEKRK